MLCVLYCLYANMRQHLRHKMRIAYSATTRSARRNESWLSLPLSFFLSLTHSLAAHPTIAEIITIEPMRRCIYVCCTGVASEGSNVIRSRGVAARQVPGLPAVRNAVSGWLTAAAVSGEWGRSAVIPPHQVPHPASRPRGSLQKGSRGPGEGGWRDVHLSSIRERLFCEW